MHIYHNLPHSQTEGVIKTTGKGLSDHPSYGHICKRINRLSAAIKKEYDRVDSDDDEIIIIVAADSTGIKITNRGQWMLDKWGLGKKGYLRSCCYCKYKDRKLLH